MAASGRERQGVPEGPRPEAPGAGAVKGRILVVDDDRFFRQLCADVLTADGFRVATAASGPEALELLAQAAADPFQLVLTDLVMPGMDGLEFLSRVKAQVPSTDVVVVTSQGSVDSAVRALKSGASDYITKPFNRDEFLLTINRAVEQRRLFDENKELRQLLRLFEISRAMSSTLEADQIARLAVTSLVQELHGSLGLALFFRPDRRSLELTAFAGLDEAAARRLAERIGEQFFGELAAMAQTREGGVRVKPVRGLGEPAAEATRTAVLVPVRGQHFAPGVVVVFSGAGRHGYDRDDLQHAAFIAEQAAIALDNAAKYLDARQLAYIDELTKLYNVRYLDVVLDRELRRADRYKTTVSLLFLDLDLFKAVNDVHGHLVGSRVLVEVAQVLRRCVREIDPIIRYGGDEYTIVLADTDRRGAFVVAERIRKGIEEHTFLTAEGLAVRLTACIGVACYPEDAKTKQQLLDMADKAMYRAKASERNRVYCASELLTVSSS
ncbi:MAG TPA: diguanylate cyclase [Thermodesulfobacteriota bacterium]|nr:diguanylate cyclase [Thermodesulfobacteriota bacterium]